MDFDYDFYLNKYSDLRHFNKQDAYVHWINYGQKEGRICGTQKINDVTKVTIIIHMFLTELFDEFLTYIKNVKNVFNNVTVIFTININSEFDIKIHKENPKFIVIKVENKGTDVHAFLECIKYMRKNNIENDFILKMHTKITNNPAENILEWRKDLIDPITNYSSLCYLQYYFKTIKNIGYVGAQKCSLPKNYDLDFYQNIEGINYLCSHFPHLEKEWTDFIGGNMFWISNAVLEKYLTPELIDYFTSRFSYGKPPCNLNDKGIYVEYLCERLFTGVFCYDRTNILVNNMNIEFNSKRGFYNPKIFNFYTPKNILI